MLCWVNFLSLLRVISLYENPTYMYLQFFLINLVKSMVTQNLYNSIFEELSYLHLFFLWNLWFKLQCLHYFYVKSVKFTDVHTLIILMVKTQWPQQIVSLFFEWLLLNWNFLNKKCRNSTINNLSLHLPLQQ